MSKINMRLAQLRKGMAEANIQFLYVPTDDDHLSEYVGDYYKVREFISGFTGSAGTVLIGMKETGLWTDGRYFLQAEQELKDTEFRLFRMGESDVPSVFEYLEGRLEEGQTLALDYRTVSCETLQKLEEAALKKRAHVISFDLFHTIWTDRPKRSCSRIQNRPLSVSGQSRVDKINDVKMWLEKKEADALILSSLDEIMWLFNIRGRDVKYCPVLLSYACILREKTILYVQKGTCSPVVERLLFKDRVEIRDYDNFFDELSEWRDKKVILDPRRVNAAVKFSLQKNNTILFSENEIQMKKAIKNSTEIRNSKNAHLKDAIAMTHFLYYLEHAKDADEFSLCEVLLNFRKEQKGFVEPSFATICGYNAHGAIVHYAPTKESSLPIKGNGLLLVDSGGQYLEGTTDITRTVVRGKISREMKRDFTLVLKGHLRLMDAKFSRGCPGSSLDVLAREPLWRDHKTYNHGTGHGVGSFLNVHEGPNGISFQRINSCPMMPGMITSDEPGYYLKDRYGIRHENLLLCVEDGKDGRFLKFIPLTLVPYDLRGVDRRLLNAEEKRILNDYHQLVYRKLHRYFSGRELNFLRRMTKRI